jgi:predicted porin
VARQKHDFRHELEVHVFVTGKAANGLSYGGVIELQNDNSGASGAGSAVDIDEAYVFLSSPTLGTMRFGEEDNAASLMQVRVPSITGFGPDGDWDDNVISNGARTGTAPSVLTGINDGNDATKIVYLSPQFFGFDFGVSYAPTAGEGERAWFGRSVDNLASLTTVQPLQRDRTSLRNELAGAVRYRGSFGNVGVAAGFGAMRADAPDASAAGLRIGGLQDVTAYTAGLNVTAFGFTVGGEYTWGKYSGASVGRSALAQGLDNSNHWVIGATYVIGAVSLGGYYGVGEQDNPANVFAGREREQTVWGVGAAYSLAPGLELVASYNSLKDERGPVNVVGSSTRDVDVVLIGARLAF